MSVFKWRAVDLYGHVSKGVDFANSPIELEQILQRRNLGLMLCKQKSADFFNRQITILVQLNFFHDLLALLSSGMPLPQVLQLFLNQTKNESLRCIIGYLLYQVQERGESFASALQSFQSVFGNLVVVVLQAGFNVGNLPQALRNVCVYLENKLQMQRELRRAILMPILTLVLFLIIAAFVFIIIVPQFSHIFTTANLPLDYSTQIVIAISDFLCSRQALISLLLMLLLFLILNLFIKTKPGKLLWHHILLYTPLIGGLIKYQNLFSFLQAAALLIEGGVPVVEAFDCANLAISNVVLQKQSKVMTKLIEQGTAINLAMRQAAAWFFPKEVISMAAIGQESGNLGKILSRTSEIYQQKFKSRLQIILSLLQPFLIICLGLLVALLIFAIYIPIFNMPAVMG
jgi:type II secretory pathway component PulF